MQMIRMETKKTKRDVLRARRPREKTRKDEETRRDEEQGGDFTSARGTNAPTESSQGSSILMSTATGLSNAEDKSNTRPGKQWTRGPGGTKGQRQRQRQRQRLDR